MQEAETPSLNTGVARGASSGFSSRAERKKSYVDSARAANKRNHAANPRFWASAEDLGAHLGVGLGLYFGLLTWLKCMFLFMMLTAVPYLVVVNSSVFTNSANSGNHEVGFKVYPQFQLSSFTFAGIVAPSLDNNTLTYMDVKIAGHWTEPMKKSAFLKWISYVDACASFVFLLAIILVSSLARRHCIKVDKQYLEVSSFTVLVKGLPSDASPKEVGEYFSRFGEVMEAQLVLDVAWLLGSCFKVMHLQQKLQLLSDEQCFHDQDLYTRRERKLVGLLDRAQASISAKLPSPPQRLDVKAAFVTFNHKQDVRRCLSDCPKSWLSSRFQAVESRFRQRHRVWVCKASAPEDYVFENFSVSKTSQVARKVLTKLVVVAVLLLSAVLITALSNYYVSIATIQWKDQLYTSAGTNSLHALPGAVSPSAACTSLLTGPCTGSFSQVYGNSLQMKFGSPLRWGNVSEGLLNLQPLLKAMKQAQAAAVPKTNLTTLKPAELVTAACLPCLCLGLEQNPSYIDPSWLSATKTQCSPFINLYSLSTWGIAAAIAVVILLINTALKYALAWLVAFEKHWSHSGREWWNAVLVFIAQLLNSVLILILVNCSQLQEASSRVSEQGSKALKQIMLNGQFPDFDRVWYETVGMAIWACVALSTANPIVLLLLDYLWQCGRRCWLLWCVRNDVQHRHQDAYARPNFNLHERVAHVLLLLTVSLMFGSGMPLLYATALFGMIVQNITDRFAVRVCRLSSRYNKHLALLIIDYLPWALLLHCLFGLWMHSFFPVAAEGSRESLLANFLVRGSGTQLGAVGLWGSEVPDRTTTQRITQPNGVPMLIAAVAVALWILWRCLRPLVAPTLWRLICLLYHKCLSCSHTSFQDLQGPPPPAAPLPQGPDGSYQSALQCGQLNGKPTYRIPHHPRYAHLFAHSMPNRLLWYCATGADAFTRLRWCHSSGKFFVSPDYIAADELETSLDNALPHSLQSSIHSLNATLLPKAQAACRMSSSMPAGAPSHPEGRMPRRPAPVHVMVMDQYVAEDMMRPAVHVGLGA